MISWAEKTGSATGRLVAGILDRRPHPEQGYRSCLGIMRLARRHGEARVEAACGRAEALGSYSYQTVKNILGARVEGLPFEEQARETATLPVHDNIRGAAYYHKEEKC